MISAQLQELRRHIIDVHLKPLPAALLNLGAIHQQMHAKRHWGHTHHGDSPIIPARQKESRCGR